jgi:hypothetical protein
MVARKTVCLRRLGGTRKGEEQVGRFFANQKVTAAKIVADWSTQTVLVHAMIAVGAASGSCLGLVGGDVWTRDGVNPVPHGQRPLAEPESAHWVDTAQQAKPVMHSAAMVTVVGDREADMYPLWGTVPGPKCHLLTRGRVDRSLADGGMLFAAAAQFPVAGLRSIELPARDPVSASAPCSLNCATVRWKSAAREVNATAAFRPACGGA